MYNDIRILLLRLNVELAIATANHNLLADLLDGIATRGAITHNFPFLQKRGLRIEVNTNMCKAAQFFCIEWVQAMHNDDLSRVQLLRSGKGASFMVVDGFHHRFSASEAAYVVGHQSNVVGSRMQCRDTSPQACSPIKYMIIVEANMHNTFLSEDPYHTIG